MFITKGSDNNKRYVLLNGKIGPRLDVFEYTFLVDQRVNIIKDKTLDEALEIIVPDLLRELARNEYSDWHKR